ncbi:hypothetical protein [Humidisolicoccus flavus]|uniref:hypothetical protein n=1 Tax=Humidisolicoccus flavus TaxID=3111414 RepID=UPI0032509E68
MIGRINTMDSKNTNMNANESSVSEVNAAAGSYASRYGKEQASRSRAVRLGALAVIAAAAGVLALVVFWSVPMVPFLLGCAAVGLSVASRRVDRSIPPFAAIAFVVGLGVLAVPLWNFLLGAYFGLMFTAQYG